MYLFYHSDMFFSKKTQLSLQHLCYMSKSSKQYMSIFLKCKLSPTLSKTTHPIVTDEERGFVNAIAKYMESCCHLRCWNYIFQDVRRWLRDPKRKAPALDTASYLQDMRALFHLPTEEEYNEELVKMRCRENGVLRFLNTTTLN